MAHVSVYNFIFVGIIVLGTYIGGVYETSETVGIAEAVKAAIRILAVFQEAKQHSILPRIAVHCGQFIYLSIICLKKKNNYISLQVH